MSSYMQSYANPYQHASQNPFGIQPPFQGVPPVPQGWNVSRDTWNKGFWQFNPAYNHAHSRAQAAPWQPAPAWAQAANVNPYKRQPKPPSAEYLATALVDNPLGLTNMIPREEVYGKDENASNTPWIWNPRGLVEDDEPDAVITANYRDENGHRVAQEARGPAPSRRSSSRQQSVERTAQPQSTEPSQIRRASESAIQHPSPHPNSRHASEPAPRSAQPMSHASAQANQAPPLSADGTRRSSFQYGPPQSVPASVPHPPPPVPPPPNVPEDFTSQLPLRPTFSLSIVRTPEHYNSPRRNSNASITNSTPPREPQHRASLESQMNQMSLHNSHSPTPREKSHRQASSLLRQQSLPNDLPTSMTGTTVFVDEPSTMLSPLIMSTPHPLADAQLAPVPSSSNNRQLGRQYSAPPGTLSAIPEASQSHNHHQRTSPHTTPPQETTTYERVSPSRNANLHISHRFPPPPVLPPMPQMSSAAAALEASPHNKPNSAHVSPRRSDSSSSRVSPRKAETSSHIHAPPPPFPSSSPPGPRRVRKGWWNRRGDHLTNDMFIVYAPQDKAYPAELADYPAEDVGYYDEFRMFMGHLPSYRELPESLPRFGKPATRPYESFISYDTYRPPNWE